MIRRSRLPLGDIFNWVTIVLGILTVVMLFVWAYSTACFLSASLETCDSTRTVWTPLTWSITCGLGAAIGMVGFLIPGLIRFVHPALLTTGSSAQFIQHWPRMAGLTFLWTGLAITTSGVFLAFHPQVFTAWSLPVNGWGIIALFVVIFGPMYGLMVIEFLARRVWRRAR